MTSATLTMSDFLLARIAEDEAAASLVLLSEVDASGGAPTIKYRAIRDRVLAECETKRRIVELADEASGIDMSLDLNAAVGSRTEPYIGDQILAAVAAVYADHPDYQPEWAV